MGKIIQNYSIQEHLGQGVYGKVYKASHLKTKQEVAIKVIHADKFKQIPKLQECTVNEINILSSIETCPYIVKYIDMLKTVNNFYFVYEFCNGGTLEKLMQKQGPFPERKAINYFRQMVEAFKILTKGNIMHRDLKPDNILMHDGSIKLGDFGFCKPLGSALEMANTMLGSPIYMAPEVLKGETYNMKADIWSLGVVLFQMIFARCPFESKSIAKLIKLLDQEDLVIPTDIKITPNLQRLLKKMLVKDFNNRIQWTELFQYTFTQNGDIFAPKAQINQFQLRSSIKSTNNNFNGSFTSSSNNLYSGNQNHNSSLSNTLNTGQKQLNLNKSQQVVNFDEVSNLMKKKSPLKTQNDVSVAVTSQYSRASRTPPNFYKNDSNNNNNNYSSKNDRTGRFEMLIKNHSKCVAINQIALDCLKLERQKPSSTISTAYLLFKALIKETTFLLESLRKQSFDSRSQEFKNIIEKELQTTKNIIGTFKQTLQQEDLIGLLGSIEEPNKIRILKHFYECSKVDSDQQDAIVTAQVVDYLDQGMLIKREAYERMGRETLNKQIRGKYAKYV